MGFFCCNGVYLTFLTINLKRAGVKMDKSWWHCFKRRKSIILRPWMYSEYCFHLDYEKFSASCIIFACLNFHFCINLMFIH